MSAPERFQVGDTVRCAAHHEPHTVTMVQPDSGDVCVDDEYGYFPATLFTLARPTPSALDPFAWDLEAFREAARWTNSPAWDEDIVAWSRFCYWAAQSNLAAHFLPTEAAARTRASNGRDVPVAYVDVRLRADTAAVYAAHPGGGVITTDHYNDVRQACRRALGGGA